MCAKLRTGSRTAAFLSIPFIRPCTPITSRDARGAPPVNVAATDRAQRIEAMDEIKRAIEVAEQIPFRFLVQHLGTGGESFDDRKFEAAMTSIEHLRAFAKPLGVRILLENIPNELSTPDKLVEFIQITHFDDVGRMLRSRPCPYHEQGGGGVRNPESAIFTPPTCTTTLATATPTCGREPGPSTGKRAMELLRSAPHTPPLLLEIEADEKVNPVEKMGERSSNLVIE